MSPGQVDNVVSSPSDRATPAETSTTTRLVERAVEGEASAARALFERHRGPVMGYCMLSAHGDRELAKDLLQECFMSVFAKLGDLRDAQAFEAWMWRIVRNTCASQGSRRGRYDDALEAFALEREVILAAEDKLARERRIACVQALLEGVKDEQLATIVRMKYTEPEHTTRQIAALLEIPHGTVTVTLMRFRRKIKARLVRELRARQLHEPSGGAP